MPEWVNVAVSVYDDACANGGKEVLLGKAAAVSKVNAGKVLHLGHGPIFKAVSASKNFGNPCIYGEGFHLAGSKEQYAVSDFWPDSGKAYQALPGLFDWLLCGFIEPVRVISKEACTLVDVACPIAQTGIAQGGFSGFGDGIPIGEGMTSVG